MKNLQVELTPDVDLYDVFSLIFQDFLGSFNTH